MDVTTNNVPKVIMQSSKVESFCSNPGIWNFIGILNEIIVDTDKEIETVCLGKVISRARKRQCIVSDDRRAACKLQLSTGIFTPLEYLKGTNSTIGKINAVEVDCSDISDESETEEESFSNVNK